MSISPSAIVGLVFWASESTIARKRSGPGAVAMDGNTMRLLGAVFVPSILLSVVAARNLPASAIGHPAAAIGAGAGLFAAGLALRWTAVICLGRFFTVDVAVASDHRVIDTGPYRWLRHPSYTGLLLEFLGLGFCLGNWASVGLLSVPIALALGRRIQVEEEALTGALGEAYRDYCRKTKRLIPLVY
jgi:protein-S-isoprenylcysteine O-methyltransferase